MDLIEQLKSEKNKYISLEDVLLFICKKYDCSLEIAAEFLLKKIPDNGNSWGDPCNPDFFGKLIGVSIFESVKQTPDLKDMLKDIISNKHYAFEQPTQPVIDDFDNVPF